THSPSFYFIFYFYVDHRDLHSFPTRRSSDLEDIRHGKRFQFDFVGAAICLHETVANHSEGGHLRAFILIERSAVTPYNLTWLRRSEEHTSELQSRENLVCRLLLEKKKKKK